MFDLHTHTIYSDGVGTPEEMVLAAIQRGLSEIGISDHCYTSFDESYCLQKDKIEAYKAEIAALKQKYKDKILVRGGIEQDIFSDESMDGYEYVIGSVHYLNVKGEPRLLDISADGYVDICKEGFGGDYYALAEKYFETVATIADMVKISIVGHLDLVTKFNEKYHFFDEEHPRFLAAAKKAIDKLLAAGKTFEINTGAISRGYRTVPYPAPRLLSYIREKGGKTIFSSDAHAPETIAYAFDKFEYLVK